MSDPRTTPINARVAAAHLTDAPSGLVRLARQVRRVTQPVANLMRAPDGPRDRQVLYGERVEVFEDRMGWSFVQAHKDGYTGYLPQAALGPDQIATHWVSAPSTHAYAAPDIKSPDQMALSFGSQLAVTSETNGFAETPAGFVPGTHLTPVGTHMTDPVDVALLFMGSPYLWGGNNRAGIDCSGLVQAGWLACGRACPGDSDQQEQALGHPLPDGSPYQRGDLLFWKGHVAQVCDPETMIHANAHHMAVVCEPIEPARARILAQGDGPVTSHRRP
ncbi:MAG: cell wall-associated NlpC family hydrolase [Paracoccaceae bacterium]